MNALKDYTIIWEKSWKYLLIERRITTHKFDPAPSSQLQTFFTSWVARNSDITTILCLNTKTISASLSLRNIQPSNLFDEGSIYRWVKEVESSMMMMNSFLFLGIGSMKEGNRRWFPNSFIHPWANSEGQVAQEKLLEVSMSNWFFKLSRNFV